MSLINYLYTLQTHIHKCGKAISLKDHIFANRLKQYLLTTYKNALSWLTNCLWFHAPKFPISDSLHISHSHIIGSNSQFNKRQISDKCKQIIKAWSQLHSVNLLTVSLLNINTSCTLTSSAYVFWTERLHSESAQVHKTLDIHHFAQPSLYINDRIKHKTTWFVIEGSNWKLLRAFNLDSFNEYPSNKRLMGVAAESSLCNRFFCASSVQKLAAGMTCLQGLKLKTCWLQHTL